MAVTEKTIRKKAVAVFGPDGGIQKRYVTVDDGFERDGEFVSGTIRDDDTDEAGLIRAFGEANSVSTKHIGELRETLGAEITELKKRIAALESAVQELEAKRARALQALA